MRRATARVAPLAREFFARATVTVARELVGCLLLVDAGTADEVRARIVEVEAYLGVRDPASHAFRGPTPRAAIMFGEAGRLYVYFSYGMHHCANLVTERDGVAGAVLLRAASVEAGEEVVRARRGASVARDGLLRGPGNLCKGLRLTLADNGLDVCTGDTRLVVVARAQRPPVMATRRIGISAGTDRPLRFLWEAHPAVSVPRPWRSGGEKEGTG
jgi:DNA-3-methyladenine glycosylase